MAGSCKQSKSGSRKRIIRELAENTYIVETTYGKVIKSRLASIKLINMPYRTTPLCRFFPIIATRAVCSLPASNCASEDKSAGNCTR